MTGDDESTEFPAARNEFQSIVDSFVRPPLEEVRVALKSASDESAADHFSLEETIKHGLSSNARDIKRRLGDPQAPEEDSILAWLQRSNEELRLLLEASQVDHDLLGALLVQTVILGDEARTRLDSLDEDITARLTAIEGGVAATNQRVEAESSALELARNEDSASRRESAEAALAHMDRAVAALSGEIIRTRKQARTWLIVAITLIVVQAALLIAVLYTVTY